MSPGYAVRVVASARAQILEASRWWRANRPKAPNALRDDLGRALELLAAQPRIGRPAQSARLARVRRLHLHRIHYDVYYRVHEGQRVVEVLAFWHARREVTPV